MSGINGIDFMVSGMIHLLRVAAASSLSAPAADKLRRQTPVRTQLSVIDTHKITQRKKVKWNP